MRKTIYAVAVVALAAVFILGAMSAIPAFGAGEAVLAENTEIAADGGLADRCYLTEAASGAVLYKKNENERHEIASMVKIMTLLLTFEAIERGEASFDEAVTISVDAAAEKGSELFLDAGEQYKLSDLIKGITVVSANDASVAVAERISGSVPAFVDKMNARAKELNMLDTKFVNATGYPSEAEQYSTAKDVNAMTRELIKHKDYYMFSSIWVEDFIHPSGRVTGLANTNKLVRFYKGCDSGKTGYTNTAKFCLSASASRGGMRVVGTLIGADTSDNRFKAMRKMFDYAFMNYKAETVIEAGASAEVEIAVEGGKLDSVIPIAKDNLTFVKSRTGEEYTVEYETAAIKAPMKRGDTVGKAKLILGGKVVAETDLILGSDVEKASFLDYIKKLCG